MATATTTPAPIYRTSSGLRPGLNRQQSATAAAPASPRTPTNTSSSLSLGATSPSARSEDDCLVFEFGTRFLRVGFAGDSTPRGVLGFGPHSQWRAGDYRQWEMGYEDNWRRRKGGRRWGEAHELWQADLRNVDLGLVEDKIERAVREAYTQYLLTDSKPRRLLLALPSSLAYPLLSTVLMTLFSNFQCPSITMLSTPILSAVAAGLRSALVVDIGWAETVTTAVFEYREVHCSRSVRACKLLVREMGIFLARHVRKARGKPDASGEENEEPVSPDNVSFEECEEVLARLGWCRKRDEIGVDAPSETQDRLQSLSLEDDDAAKGNTLPGQTTSPTVSVPLRSTLPPITLWLPFSDFAHPTEKALLPVEPAGDSRPDDHELSIHDLAYHALLALPTDVRAVCMSRIVICGGGSSIPGLKRRIVDEIDELVTQRGWDPVHGRASERRKAKLQASRRDQGDRASSVEAQKTGEHTDESDAANVKTAPAYAQPESDPIMDKVRRNGSKPARPPVQGKVRAVESLGAWAGGSLVGALKIKGVLEVEKDRFLSQGLAGASKEGEVSVVLQRLSLGPNVPRSGAGDRSSWTLGAWA